MVEFAIVGPLTLLLLIGLMVGGVGVFRKHQVASLSAGGARWAAVHGPRYQKRTKTTVKADDVYKTAIRPLAIGMKEGDLKYSIQWDASNTVVTVTVSYSWLPQAFFEAGTLSSTAVMPVSY